MPLFSNIPCGILLFRLWVFFLSVHFYLHISVNNKTTLVPTFGKGAGGDAFHLLSLHCLLNKLSPVHLSFFDVLDLTFFR